MSRPNDRSDTCTPGQGSQGEGQVITNAAGKNVKKNSTNSQQPNFASSPRGFDAECDCSPRPAAASRQIPATFSADERAPRVPFPQIQTPSPADARRGQWLAP